MKYNLSDYKKLNIFLNTATDNELKDFIHYMFFIATDTEIEILKNAAMFFKEKYYGKKIFFRALIEFTSYCKNDCYYCGLRLSNKNAVRYRMSKAEILNCCDNAYLKGFKTFVLQGGEDNYYKDKLPLIVKSIKQKYPDAAVTLSVGELKDNQYEILFKSGADRYLLRHETADSVHFSKLHPPFQKLENRINCLKKLKQIGYQTGAGFMVGSPFQSESTLSQDLILLRELQPEMTGIGPFIPHKDTKFKNCEIKDIKYTLIMLAVVRIMLPKVLLPSTTALATIEKENKFSGFMYGANVLMPNATDLQYRKDYSLYDNKKISGSESAEEFIKLKNTLTEMGYQPVMSRGDHFDFNKEKNGI